MADKESIYVNVNIRFARVVHRASKAWLAAQERIVGRRFSFNQFVIEAVIEKLEREGFHPAFSPPTQGVPLIDTDD